MTCSDQWPAQPAMWPNGHFVKLGHVIVDSAMLAITDPTSVEGPHRGVIGTGRPYGSGVQFMAGFGDGSYDVWGWVVDYGEHGEVDERIAQVVVTLVDEDDLTDWRQPS